MAAAERDLRPRLHVVEVSPAHVTNRRPTPAAVGWLALVGGIVAFDAWALATGRETLSSCFDRMGARHRQTRSVKVAVVAGLTYHLLFEKDRGPTL